MSAGTISPDSSLRLRPWAALVLFVSAYAPLLLILAIKDLDATRGYPVPTHPWLFGALLVVAVLSCFIVLRAVRSIRVGLSVQVSKAANKSGEMFGYTIPYVLSVVRIDLGDWQTLAISWMSEEARAWGAQEATASIARTTLRRTPFTMIGWESFVSVARPACALFAPSAPRLCGPGFPRVCPSRPIDYHRSLTAGMFTVNSPSCYTALRLCYSPIL